MIQHTIDDQFFLLSRESLLRVLGTFIEEFDGEAFQILVYIVVDCHQKLLLCSPVVAIDVELTVSDLHHITEVFLDNGSIHFAESIKAIIDDGLLIFAVHHHRYSLLIVVRNRNY